MALFLRNHIIDSSLSLEQLNDVSHRKLQEFSRWDKDAADTVVWLRNNQHRFRKPVLEPPYLSVSVPDRRFVDGAESCLGSNQMKVTYSASIFECLQVALTTL